LTTLREKARHALAAVQSKSSETPSDGELWNIKKEQLDPDDELTIFAGRTRLVNRTLNASGVGAGPPEPVEVTTSSEVQGGTSGFVLNPISSMDERIHNQPRQHRSSSQLRRQYVDVDMEPPSKYDSMYDAESRRASQSYHHPAPPLRLHHRPSLPNSGLYPGSSDSSSLNEWLGDNTRTREDYHTNHHHPATISIPPAPVHSSVDEPSPHRSIQHFNYSYDRSSRSGPSPVTPSNYSWSSSQSYPLRHSSSPVRLTHPQYGPSSSQVQPDASMHTFDRPSTHQMYSGPGVVGFNPHPLAVHPPGHAALADLGLASRDSRLDERWSSFMQDSGLLEDFGRGGR
jgi:hypothetical protein